MIRVLHYDIRKLFISEPSGEKKDKNIAPVIIGTISCYVVLWPLSYDSKINISFLSICFQTTVLCKFSNVWKKFWVRETFFFTLKMLHVIRLAINNELFARPPRTASDEWLLDITDNGFPSYSITSMFWDVHTKNTMLCQLSFETCSYFSPSFMLIFW